MRILIVAPFCSLPGETHFNRFLHLSRVLSENHEVVLITSRFRHFDKEQREISQNSENFSIVLIDEPGYKRNVSLARVLSHAVFFRNFRVWFENSIYEKKADVVYSAYPLISTNLYLGTVKKRLGFKFILDIQDVWPESIASVFPVLRHFDPQWLPLSRKADKVYRSADVLVAVSKTYLQRAKSVNGHALSKVVYIGCDGVALPLNESFDLNPEDTHFVYAGTLSHSYDLRTVVKGFAKIWNEGGKNFILHILGDGPDRNVLESLSKPNVKFYGFIQYTRMLAFLRSVDVCINALSVGAQQSVTNKFCDYVFSGKCIVNSQTNSEILGILKEFPHVNYLAGDLDDFVKAIRISAGVASKHASFLLLEKFDRSRSYPDLVKFIEMSHDTLSA